MGVFKGFIHSGMLYNRTDVQQTSLVQMNIVMKCLLMGL